MIKSIIKEISIILLLIIAIVLILGIMFYDYRPSTMKIPSSIGKYSLPEEMQAELNETIQESETQNIVKIYRVDSEDLEDYEDSGDYVQGKINPFSKIPSTTDKDDDNDSNNQNNTSSENNSENTSQNGTGTQGNFLNTVK